MTQEEKDLLLKDICARLPYGVQVEHDYIYKGEKYIGICSLDSSMLKYIDWTEEDNEGTEYKDHKLIPYLRSMSSMTEEEFNSLNEITDFKYGELELAEWANGYKTLEFYLEEIPSYALIEVFDWLNAHHFDYRGLIEKGLALEAPEGMYKPE